MSEWQPIETAPKDGTHILLHVDGSVIEGWWYQPNYDGGVADWNVESVPSHGCGCCSEENPDPIAWMPLPAAPKP